MSYISTIREKDVVKVWERGDDDKRIIKTYPAPYYFFIEDPNGEYISIFGDKLEKVKFLTYNDYKIAKDQYTAKGYRLFESDISPEIRVLSNNYYKKPAPKLHSTFYDIEVDYDIEIGFAGTENPYAPLNAVAVYNDWQNRMVVYAVPPPNQTWTNKSLRTAMEKIEPFPTNVDIEIIICKNEKQLLLEFLVEIEDSDLIGGWNSGFFDTPYIAKRLELTLGQQYFNKLSFTGARKPKFGTFEIFGRDNIIIDLSGRINCDYLKLFKKYEMGERSTYKLASVSEDVLPDLPKLEYPGTLQSLYTDDFAFFCRYNLRDTEILKGFEDKLGYVALANEMYHLSTGMWRHVGGTIGLAELAINNHCIHELKQRVPNIKPPIGKTGIAGAYVLEPKTGVHEWVGSVDINSLYPSAIRSCNISPEKIIGQFYDDEKACVEISKESAVTLQLIYEDNTAEEMAAHEWNKTLRERKWCVSGYGTVFDQTEKGIIPTILEEWYATRKEYQKLMREALTTGQKEKSAYYDRLQYVMKIKLNSCYGALTNAYFRYYDLRMGESTTAIGRMVLRHQCATANKLLTGKYETLGEAIIGGDTDSSYFKTFAGTQDEAIQIGDAVAEGVNATFQTFMQDTFLCQPGYDDIIKAGREVIASRGIFVEKKRYALRVIDNEGQKTDKLKIMGLDLKKTTIPPAVAIKLTTFLERFLKGEKWDSLAQDIVDYKEWINTTDQIMDIGLPKGVQNVEKYTENWEKQSTANLPGHVAASIFWNKCLIDYDDKVSQVITSGTKIKVFYLDRTYGRFKSIAIPTDIEVVPVWFIDGFRINRKMHIERLVDNPLNNIFKAINKKTPSAQSMLTDTLLSF